MKRIYFISVCIALIAIFTPEFAEAQAIASSMPGISNTYVNSVNYDEVSQNYSQEASQSYGGGSYGSNDVNYNHLMSKITVNSRKSKKMWRNIMLFGAIFAIGYIISKVKRRKPSSKTPVTEAAMVMEKEEVAVTPVYEKEEVPVSDVYEKAEMVIPAEAEEVEVIEEAIEVNGEKESSPVTKIENIMGQEKTNDTQATASRRSISDVKIEDVVEFIGKILSSIITLIIKIITLAFSIVKGVIRVFIRLMGSLFSIVKEEAAKQKTSTPK